jgi:hypothetical protein
VCVGAPGSGREGLALFADARRGQTEVVTVDVVGHDAIVESLSDGSIQPIQRIQERLAFASHQAGACQRSCRLCYAAVADSFSAVTAAVTTESRSGLRVTTAIGCQLRVCLAQRLGLAARARVYSWCLRDRMLRSWPV